MRECASHTPDNFWTGNQLHYLQPWHPDQIGMVQGLKQQRPMVTLRTNSLNPSDHAQHATF